MQDRQLQLLKGLVDMYVQTAEPVGSQALLDYCNLNVSSATVRNDLKVLEQEGYVSSPHTSAGRVPTAKAYRYYVEHCIAPVVSQEVLGVAQEHATVADPVVRTKAFAKALAVQINQAVFVVISPEQLYYTGLSHLFSQPEFADQGSVQNVTRLLDRFDEVVHDLFGLVEDKDMHVHIGPGNPFGDVCSIMHIPCEITAGQKSLFGILGPTRMDYNTTIGVMKCVKEFLAK